MQLVSHKVIQKQLTNVTELSFLLHSGTNLFFLSIAHSFFPRAGQVDVLTFFRQSICPKICLFLELCRLFEIFSGKVSPGLPALERN